MGLGLQSCLYKFIIFFVRVLKVSCFKWEKVRKSIKSVWGTVWSLLIFARQHLHCFLRQGDMPLPLARFACLPEIWEEIFNITI